MDSIPNPQSNWFPRVTLPPISELINSVPFRRPPDSSCSPYANAQPVQKQDVKSSTLMPQLKPSMKRLRESSPGPRDDSMQYEPPVSAAYMTTQTSPNDCEYFESPRLQNSCEQNISALECVPYVQGWFDPACEYARRMLVKIKTFNLEELCDCFFVQDPRRPLYGQENQTRPGRRPMTDSVDDQNPDEQQLMERQRNTRHSGNERDRRGRHFRWQKDSAQKVPEICYEATDELLEAQFGKPSKTYRSQPRAPGKDDQLLGALFALPLGAIIIQKLRAVCRIKDNRIKMLEQQVENLTRQNNELTRFYTTAHMPTRVGTFHLGTGYTPLSPSPSSDGTGI